MPVVVKPVPPFATGIAPAPRVMLSTPFEVSGELVTERNEGTDNPIEVNPVNDNVLHSKAVPPVFTERTWLADPIVDKPVPLLLDKCLPI